MKKHLFRKTLWLTAMALLFSSASVAQKNRSKPKPKSAPMAIIFAVLRDGKLIEPIGYVDKKKLAALGDTHATKAFGNLYYKAKSAYPIIFGGAADGKVEVVTSNIGKECTGNSADIIAKPVNAMLKGLVMALATNISPKKNSAAYRRRPTPQERTAIEALVGAEFIKAGLAPAVLKELRYHNLTALDVDNDGTAEFVGSYWVAPKVDERALLFFIAEHDTEGKIVFAHSDYSLIKPDDVMSGEVKDLDGGVGHELLLDVLDYDGDGVKEIFTLGQAFEGNNYYSYRRDSGKWTRSYESYNYRCAF
ncbi:MAG: hypothetical protein WBD22_04045 [Pyrinomonadaceae bacterium]